MPSFRNINRMQLVLAVVIIMSHLSSADFECQFGSRGWYLYQLSQCSIETTTWGTVSGRGSNGMAPSGNKNDGFFITAGLNSQNQAIFQLPNLSLTDQSGSLSFHYKFFDPGTSTLTISVCGRVIRNVTPRSRGNWESISGIRIYCNGQRPTVQFTAVWGHTTGRIGVDNINIVSTTPPTITTTVSTTTVTQTGSTMSQSTTNMTDRWQKEFGERVGPTRLDFEALPTETTARPLQTAEFQTSKTPTTDDSMNSVTGNKTSTLVIFLGACTAAVFMVFVFGVLLGRFIMYHIRRQPCTRQEPDNNQSPRETNGDQETRNPGPVYATSIFQVHDRDDYCDCYIEVEDASNPDQYQSLTSQPPPAIYQDLNNEQPDDQSRNTVRDKPIFIFHSADDNPDGYIEVERESNPDQYQSLTSRPLPALYQEPTTERP